MRHAPRHLIVLARPAVLVGALLAAGCTSPLERGAFDQWRNVRRVEYPHLADASLTHQASPAPAPATLPGDLPGILDIALKHHPMALAALREWEMTLQKIPQARALPDPKFFASYKSLTEEQEFGVAQMLPWPQRLDARAQAAGEAALAAYARFRAAQRAVVRETRQAVAELVYLDQALLLMAQNVTQAQDIAELTRRRIASGRGMQTEAIRAQAEIDKAQSEVESMRLLRPALLARLNAATGQPAATVWPVLNPPSLSTADLDEAALRRRLEQDNPELSALAGDVAQARRNIRVAELESLPEIELSISDMSMPDMDGQRGDGATVMGSVTIPLWREKYDAMKREALAAWSANVHRRQDRLNRLQEELAMAIYTLRDADRRHTLYQDRLIPRTQQALTAGQSAYLDGKMTLSDLAMLRRDLTDFRIALLRAQADRAQQLALIDQLAPESPPITGPSEQGQGPREIANPKSQIENAPAPATQPALVPENHHD